MEAAYGYSGSGLFGYSHIEWAAMRRTGAICAASFATRGAA